MATRKELIEAVGARYGGSRVAELHLVHLADSTGRCNTLISASAGGVLQMKYCTRIYYTEAQKALMWERWRQGWTLHQIAQLFDRAHGSVRGIFERTGGFRTPRRSRSPIALTLAEREEISRSVAEGHSIRSTAARLGRAPSTVSREIRRNGGQADYRAADADHAAWDRALRLKCCKLASNTDLARIVTAKLRLLWSPEQIAGWLKHTQQFAYDFTTVERLVEDFIEAGSPRSVGRHSSNDEACCEQSNHTAADGAEVTDSGLYQVTCLQRHHGPERTG